MKAEEIVTDEDLGTLYVSRGDLNRWVLLSACSVYPSAHAAEFMTEQGLIRHGGQLTRKGKHYLWAVFEDYL